MQAKAEKIIAPAHQSFHFWKRSAAHFPFYWHFHPEVELTVILKGRGRRFVGDQIASYGPGDLVLVGCNLPHSWASDPRSAPGQQALVLQFSAGFLGEAFFQAPELREIRGLLNRAARGLSFSASPASRAIARLKALGKLQNLDQLLELLKILSLLSQDRRAKSLSGPGSSLTLQLENRQRIDKVCGYMAQHFREALPLSQAAGLLHMSESAFSRFFARRCGKSFVAYLNELRVSYACKLLLEGDQAVSEICFESGFNNLSNFNRQFLKLKKSSPQAFRASFEK